MKYLLATILALALLGNTFAAFEGMEQFLERGEFEPEMDRELDSMPDVQEDLKDENKEKMEALELDSDSNIEKEAFQLAHRVDNIVSKAQMMSQIRSSSFMLSQYTEGSICGIIDNHKGQCGDKHTYSSYICYKNWAAGKFDKNPICGAYNKNSDCQKHYAGKYICKGDAIVCGIIDNHKGQCGDKKKFPGGYICWTHAKNVPSWDKGKVCGAYNAKSDCQKRGGKGYICHGYAK